ncbi:Zeaxanthin epoxidase, chloroplastic [Hordeum vulgare]|nr:Zeaxanthin epoxidase, chloroplastic [Hordeum vulgare]
MRAVGRKALLEALAEELPRGTVRFSSKLVSIDTVPAAGGSSEATVLRLEDGAVIRAKAPLPYRNPWAVLTSKADRGPVTVAGDAFHPMTPEMAQGGCSALEDAVVLARALSRATTPSEGLAAYVAKRRVRAAWLVAVAYVSGWVQHGGTC